VREAGLKRPAQLLRPAALAPARWRPTGSAGACATTTIRTTDGGRLPRGGRGTA